jgi:hypothetical protein
MSEYSGIRARRDPCLRSGPAASACLAGGVEHRVESAQAPTGAPPEVDRVFVFVMTAPYSREKHASGAGRALVAFSRRRRRRGRARIYVHHRTSVRPRCGVCRAVPA